jgi:hypothetical protein
MAVRVVSPTVLMSLRAGQQLAEQQILPEPQVGRDLLLPKLRRTSAAVTRSFRIKEERLRQVEEFLLQTSVSAAQVLLLDHLPTDKLATALPVRLSFGNTPHNK